MKIAFSLSSALILLASAGASLSLINGCDDPFRVTIGVLGIIFFFGHAIAVAVHSKNDPTKRKS